MISAALTTVGGVALSVVLALALGLALPLAAEAAHGVSIAKQCEQGIRTCQSDSDCSDSNACNGTETCDLTIPNQTDCDVILGYNDSFGDTVSIDNAYDSISSSPIPTTIGDPGDPTQHLPITAVSGNTTCTVGGSLPCLIGPAGSTLSGLPGTNANGEVTFTSNQYSPTTSDPDPLPDQGHVVVHDLCDAPGTTGCSSIESDVEFPATTDLVTGCVPGTPLTCDDGNVCNGTETCDPVLGCVPGTPLVCDDGNVCNGTETCDPTLGCQPGTPLVCNDGNVCNGTETCDPTLGCQPGTPLDCSDGNTCTDDVCDPTTGCSNPDNGTCGEGCLTLTPGYWGNHLTITNCFLPVDSCGIEINNVDLTTPGSAVEDLCKNNGEATDNNVQCTSDQQLSLIRQCTAAFINLSVTNQLGGSCSDRLTQIGQQFGFTDLLGQCCDTDSICNEGASGQTISSSACIDAVTAFNADSNTFNPPVSLCPATLTCSDGSEITTGPNCAADSSTCDTANSNNWINPDRNLGGPVNPKKCQ